MANYLLLMRQQAERASREDFQKAKETLATLLPTLTTTAQHQKAYDALQAKAMSIWFNDPSAKVSAIVALKVAEAGGLEPYTP